MEREGNHLALKMLTVVDMVASPPDRRMPMEEAMVAVRLALMMLMDPGDR